MANTHNHAAKDHLHSGPSAGELIRLGAILAVITALEFGIVYLTGMRTLVVIGLFLLSVVKFYFVVSVFMHARYDNRLLSWVFGSGVFMATAMVISLYYILLA